MPDPESDYRRHRYAVERLETQAELRDRQRQTAALHDVEVKRLKGESEEALTRLRHEQDIENRQLDIQFGEYQNAQQLRMESLQTTIKQHDDLFRHFWEIDKEIVRLETRLVEIVVAARIGAEQSVTDHRNAMEIKSSEQAHALKMEAENRTSTTHTTDQEIRKERAIRELDREFGTRDIKDMVETMRHIKDFDNNK